MIANWSGCPGVSCWQCWAPRWLYIPYDVASKYKDFNGIIREDWNFYYLYVSERNLLVRPWSLRNFPVRVSTSLLRCWSEAGKIAKMLTESVAPPGREIIAYFVVCAFLVFKKVVCVSDLL